MERLNTPLLTIPVLAGFLWLAIYAYTQATPYEGYDKQSRADMEALVEQSLYPDYLSQLEVALYRDGRKL